MSIFKKFQPIAAALAPNYTFRDCLIAEKYLLLPWNWKRLREGKNQAMLEDKFRTFLGSKCAVSFDSGRSGFYAILRCLGIKDYDEIILQAFTTVALPNAIKWCGAKPIFVDINEKTYNIDPAKIEEKITEKTKAIVVQHTFGNPVEMDKILEIASKHKLFIIEDCAHSLGAEYKNKKTGTFGIASFFSFGRDKVISAVSGGMVATNDESLGKKITKLRNQMPYPEKSLIAKQLLHPLITSAALKIYYFFSLGKIIMHISMKFGILTRAYTKGEKNNCKPDNFPTRMSNALAEIVLHQIKLLDKFNDHRIGIAGKYQRKLTENKFISLPKSIDNSKNIFLWYTILAQDKKKLIKEAAKKHMILGDWFLKPIGPIEVNLENSGYKRGSCPIAEKVSSRCVNLPTHRGIEEKEAEKVTNFINEFYKG